MLNSVACGTCEQLKTQLIARESALRAYRWFFESKAKNVRALELRQLKTDEARTRSDLEAARLELRHRREHNAN